MAAHKTLLGLLLCLLGTTALATTRSPRLGGRFEQCNLQRLTTAQPADRLEFEGGSIETWDHNHDQFQCVGVAPVRKTIRPNALSLPEFHPYPRLIFVEQGSGIIGIHLPGCAETFDTGVDEQGWQGQGQEQEREREHQRSTPRRMAGRGQEQGGQRDSHQKLRRFEQGDIIAIPAGAVHWTYNDRNEEIIGVSINDLNNPANQLDLQPRPFYLAGAASQQSGQGQQGRRRGQQQQEGQQGRRRGQQQQEGNAQNIFNGFDTELLAEAFNSDPETVRSLQESGNQGLIVNVQERMQFITPDEQQEEQGQRRRQRGGSNGLEESVCSAKLVYRLDTRREADISSRQAGRLNTVNQHKLPVLRNLDLSAEKGYLQPNALLSPNWATRSHTIVYVLNGEAQVQVVSNNGEAVLDEQVNRGDIYVVPQFFANTLRAGQNGFEWVAFKTSGSPIKSPVAGYTSVFRALPLEVITNAYDVSPSQAHELKTNRETESILFSPQQTSQRD